MGMKVVLEALGLDGVLLWKYTEKEDQGHCLENSGLLLLGVQRPLSLAPATLAFTFPLPIFPWLFLEHTYEPPASASLDLLFCFPHTRSPSSPHPSLSHIVPALMYCLLLRELFSDHLHPVRLPTSLSLSISFASLYFAAQDLWPFDIVWHASSVIHLPFTPRSSFLRLCWIVGSMRWEITVTAVSTGK